LTTSRLPRLGTVRRKDERRSDARIVELDATPFGVSLVAWGTTMEGRRSRRGRSSVDEQDSGFESLQSAAEVLSPYASRFRYPGEHGSTTDRFPCHGKRTGPAAGARTSGRMPRNTSPTWRSPSTARAPTSLRPGPSSGTTNWKPGTSTLCSWPCARRRVPRGSPQVRRLRRPQLAPHDLSRLLGPGLVHVNCGLGGGLQGRHRYAAQARRHALDRRRRQRAIIALRCSKLSGRFEDFWERRTQRASTLAAAAR
jgi:hypothetical protein